MKTPVQVALVFLLGYNILVAGYISSIALDPQSPSIYVSEVAADGSFVYELIWTNSGLAASSVYPTTELPNDTVVANGLKVFRNGGNSFLYGIIDNIPLGTTKVVRHQLPLDGNVAFSGAEGLTIGAVGGRGAVWDEVDNILVSWADEDLVLVDLDSEQVLDSIAFWTSNRMYSANIVYNHNNKKVTIIHTTSLPRHAPYCMNVTEFSTDNNNLEEIPSTFKYSCESGNVFRGRALYACQIDYASPAHIWCISLGSSIVSFLASDLSNVNFLPTEVWNWGDAVFDFVNSKAYIIGIDDATGFIIQRINLLNGQVEQSGSGAIFIDGDVIAIDIINNSIYVAVEEYPGEPARIVIINTNTLTFDIFPLAR